MVRGFRGRGSELSKGVEEVTRVTRLRTGVIGLGLVS